MTEYPLTFSVIIRRLGITLVLAILLACLLAVLLDEDVAGFSFLPSWAVLFFGWPYLSRLGFLNFRKAPALPKPRPPAPKRPLWLRLVRGTLAWVGGIVLMLFLMSLTAIVPIVLCHRRAQRVHDAVHIGMTVPEVLHTARDCDIFQASSEFPHDDAADPDPNNIPAMSLGWRKDGTYRTYDLATRQNLQLSEAEAIARLHAKLHDGYRWHFRYTYINMTPQHVSFSVVFGPDGRVAE